MYFAVIELPRAKQNEAVLDLNYFSSMFVNDLCDSNEAFVDGDLFYSELGVEQVIIHKQ